MKFTSDTSLNSLKQTSASVLLSRLVDAGQRSLLKGQKIVQLFPDLSWGWTRGKHYKLSGPQNKEDLKFEDYLKNEDDIKNDDNFRREDLKNVASLKTKEDFKIEYDLRNEDA